ncbi:MAG: cupin domain-containing protein [Clostridia bacterium]|nr:cupin domain-containing protein [Clostridia bacterium]
MDIGSKIKQIRLQRSLTQEELASRCELTKGYISQLENDLCSPSIATLMDILNVLGVDLQYFFSDKQDEQIVFTDKDFFVSTEEESSQMWLVPNSQKNQMEPIILLLQSGASSQEREPFEGEEFGYILEGRITISIGEKQYKAKKGDSFYINGKYPHYLTNKSSSSAKVLWVVTPSNF